MKGIGIGGIRKSKRAKANSISKHLGKRESARTSRRNEKFSETGSSWVYRGNAKICRQATTRRYCYASRWNWRGPIGHKFQSTAPTTLLVDASSKGTRNTVRVLIEGVARILRPLDIYCYLIEGTLIGSRRSLVSMRNTQHTKT